MIPAGTGMRKYRDMKLFTKDTEDLDAHVANILEQRRKEAELLAQTVGTPNYAADEILDSDIAD
jgi:DNA-directed RNA polymerase subunit beta'